ncbi:MAG: hypothetical protein HY015_03480 [Bacteroidetes bacterium]|nr:hypothetical protein [Bacteroidota bacterium]MBI3482026.1 hypothetical protein [Bacteroidota bacterium]
MRTSRVKKYEERIELFSKVNEVAVLFNNANPTNKNMSAIDFRDEDILKFFRDLELKKVKYLLVGGFAMAFHGYVRATHDLDLWLKDDPENIEKLKDVLSENGVKGIEKSRELQLVAGFTQFNVGTSGFVVDPMTNLKAFSSFDFDQCYERAKPGEFKGIHFKVVHMNDLLKEKESTNRPKDQADIIHLREMKGKQKE